MDVPNQLDILTPIVQYIFAGMCVVLLGGQWWFMVATISHLRKTEEGRCLRHAQELAKIADAVNTHTGNSGQFHEAVKTAHIEMTKQIIKSTEAVSELMNKISAQVVIWKDNAECMMMVREQLRASARKLESLTDERAKT